MEKIGYKALPTKSIVNIRDLGGYPTKDGGVTKYGVFVRSAFQSRASKEDIDYLALYGITLNIDFRSSNHAEKRPSPFSNDPRFEYKNIPIDPEKLKGIEFTPDFSWGREYSKIVDENKDWVGKVIKAIAQNEGGCIFNCSVGKDRTGIIAAVLLLLVGVSGDDIAADYSVSEIYLRGNIERISENLPKSLFKDGAPDLENPFFRSSYKYMEILIKHLNDTYGSIEDYLSDCGISVRQMYEIKKRFVGYD